MRSTEIRDAPPSPPGALIRGAFLRPIPGVHLRRRHRLLIDEVWYFALEKNRWPTYAELDRRLDHNCDLALDQVKDTLPRGLLHRVGRGEHTDRDEPAVMALTVAGVCATGRGRRELQLFLDAVRYAAKVQREYEPPAGDPQRLPVLTSQALATHLGREGGPGDGLLARVGLLLCSEPWCSRRASPSAGGWAFDIDRGVRRFRDVTTLKDYCRLRRRPARVGTASHAPGDGQAVVPAPAGGSEAIMAVLTGVGAYLAGLQVHWQLPRTGSLVVLLTITASALTAALRQRRWPWRPAPTVLLLALAALAAVCFALTF
ncbi:hypothetical protein QLQ12_10275 [Actinoplanes sp. NEAU-A12]|uniref:Uncharacterized protein n=1 Tax=Actinoplanes sandaracinus TaxID=3045177 RepID=A0ABT6WGY6_9ACTN|nr:hypothetical protein [Actinoplanes sandaracinus]MDI6098986.1 hypothetical protein [Actinoplanes sandaracinus]